MRGDGSVRAHSGVLPRDRTTLESDRTDDPIGDPVSIRALGTATGWTVERTQPWSRSNPINSQIRRENKDQEPPNRGVAPNRPPPAPLHGSSTKHAATTATYCGGEYRSLARPLNSRYRSPIYPESPVKVPDHYMMNPILRYGISNSLARPALDRTDQKAPLPAYTPYLTVLCRNSRRRHRRRS